MSHADLIVTAEKKDILVTAQPRQSVEIETPTTAGVIVIAAGNVGPRGPAGKWEAMTQSEYDAIVAPDPDTLYVIIQ